MAYEAEELATVQEEKEPGFPVDRSPHGHQWTLSWGESGPSTYCLRVHVSKLQRFREGTYSMLSAGHLGTWPLQKLWDLLHFPAYKNLSTQVAKFWMDASSLSAHLVFNHQFGDTALQTHPQTTHLSPYSPGWPWLWSTLPNLWVRCFSHLTPTLLPRQTPQWPRTTGWALICSDLLLGPPPQNANAMLGHTLWGLRLLTTSPGALPHLTRSFHPSELHEHLEQETLLYLFKAAKQESHWASPGRRMHVYDVGGGEFSWISQGGGEGAVQVRDWGLDFSLDSPGNSPPCPSSLSKRLEFTEPLTKMRLYSPEKLG